MVVTGICVPASMPAGISMMCEVMEGGAGAPADWPGMPGHYNLVVFLLARFNPHRQPVLRRRQRASRVIRKSARRIVSLVEIQNHFAALRHIRVEEPARAVGFLARRLIAEDIKKLCRA